MSATNEKLVERAFRTARRSFVGVGIFSLAINLLMLTGPLFMLQVYDRVLTSRSVPTLLALFILIVVLFAFLGFFDFIRARVLSRVGYRLDQTLMGVSFRAWIFQGLAGQRQTYRPINDLTTIRGFMGSAALPALFDLPWTPLYLTIVFFLHVKLGLLALIGLSVVTVVALLNEWLTRRPLSQAGTHEFEESRFAEQGHRNAEAIIAMGMIGNVVQSWKGMRETGLIHAQRGGERSERFTSFSKAFRMLVQSSILGLGAYLAILQEISPGTIIAASIIAGRALAPVDQTIGNWRNILKARQAHDRLQEKLTAPVSSPQAIALPEPQGNLLVQGLTKLTPDADGDTSGERSAILQNVSFELKPGDAVGVIGPSGSGKTTLARVLIGLWPADRGAVRLDGATHDQWDVDALGQHLGYLPQSIELLAGSIHQNIARFDPEAEDEAVIAAAKLAGVHDLILRLPEGYATQIGHGRTPLSGGQAQRIALARAVFRTPKFIVLDEPNSNLDIDGDTALTQTIEKLREAGSAVVVMAHRPSAIAAVNLILMLQNGQVSEFGPKAEVLKKVTRVASSDSGAINQDASTTTRTGA